MNKSTDTIRVVIPLTVRRRNGRPKILPPPENAFEQETQMQNPHILKALGRAWAWRRRLESGEVSTAGELAKMEGVTERFVSRTVRLAYMSPIVLHHLLLIHAPAALALPEIIESILVPWPEQQRKIFGEECL